MRKYRDPSDGSLIENRNPRPLPKHKGKVASDSNYYRPVRGYCRICWKRFDVTVDVAGLDSEGMLNAARYKVRCCKTPDLRLQ